MPDEPLCTRPGALMCTVEAGDVTYTWELANGVWEPYGLTLALPDQAEVFANHFGAGDHHRHVPPAAEHAPRTVATDQMPQENDVHFGDPVAAAGDHHRHFPPAAKHAQPAVRIVPTQAPLATQAAELAFKAMPASAPQRLLPQAAEDSPEAAAPAGVIAVQCKAVPPAVSQQASSASTLGPPVPKQALLPPQLSATATPTALVAELAMQASASSTATKSGPPWAFSSQAVAQPKPAPPPMLPMKAAPKQARAAKKALPVLDPVTGAVTWGGRPWPPPADPKAVGA